jgi:hypothetical protein
VPAPPMPSSASAPLDGPPPSPQMLGAGPMGQPTPVSLDTLAPGDPMTSGQMPPEILTGILQAAQRIESVLDSFAQVAPDLGMDFALIKNQLATTLAKLVERGAQPTSPTATGAAFPGGGMDRGIAGPGAI